MEADGGDSNDIVEAVFINGVEIFDNDDNNADYADNNDDIMDVDDDLRIVEIKRNVDDGMVKDANNYIAT